MAHQRIPKPLRRKFRDLDDNLYLLRQCVVNHRGDSAYLKLVAVLLRSLACYSSGTEGLLWRLTEKLGVSDGIALDLVGDAAGPARHLDDLAFSYSDLNRPGYGLSRGSPTTYSLKAIIKERNTTAAGGEPLTHEELIRAVAEQLGAAHEDEGISPALATLEQVRIGGEVPYVAALTRDAAFVLQVGERVLAKAERQYPFTRQPRERGYGDLTVALLIDIESKFPGSNLLYTLRSWVSEVDIQFGASSGSWQVLSQKGNGPIRELACNYPAGMAACGSRMVALEYSSRAQRARLSVNGSELERFVEVGLGWIHAHELARIRKNVDGDDSVSIRGPKVFHGCRGPDWLSSLAIDWREN